MSEIAASPDPERYALRLYVTGSTARSLRAIENIKRIAGQHLDGIHTLEIVDIYQHADAASEHQVVASPTLVRIEPKPVRRVIGDLSDEARVLSGLEITPVLEPRKINDARPD